MFPDTVYLYNTFLLATFIKDHELLSKAQVRGRGGNRTPCGLHGLSILSTPHLTLLTFKNSSHFSWTAFKSGLGHSLEVLSKDLFWRSTMCLCGKINHMLFLLGINNVKHSFFQCFNGQLDINDIKANGSSA